MLRNIGNSPGLLATTVSCTKTAEPKKTPEYRHRWWGGHTEQCTKWGPESPKRRSGNLAASPDIVKYKENIKYKGI